jgi:hypothetical protein
MTCLYGINGQGWPARLCARLSVNLETGRFRHADAMEAVAAHGYMAEPAGPGL